MPSGRAGAAAGLVDRELTNLWSWRAALFDALPLWTAADRSAIGHTEPIGAGDPAVRGNAVAS
jgi:hypothetical protein